MENKKIKIALYAASDRNNYGDLLMPIFVKNILENNSNYEFTVISTTTSNLQYVGALPTISFKEVKRNELKFDVGIVCGGHVFGATYTTMYSYLVSDKNILANLFLRAGNKFFPRAFNSIYKCILSGRNIMPWVLDNTSNSKVIYNTIGGDFESVKNLKYKQKIYNHISNTSLLSSRDNRSFSNLSGKIKKDVLKLVPDSITIMSDIFTENFFKINVSDETKGIIKSIDKYIVIQCNLHIGKNNISTISSELNKLKKMIDYKIILLPIGYATGHEDQHVLSKIYKLVDDTIFFDKLTVIDTAYVLANCTLYCGSSLHGAITAISYEKKHIAIAPNCTKLINYQESWNTTPLLFTEIDKISENIIKLLNIYDEEHRKNLLINHKKMIYDNYDEIKKILDDNEK